MNKFLTAIVLAMLLGFSQPALCKLAMIKTPQKAVFVVPVERTPSLEKVHDSVILAATGRGWQIVSDQTGKFILRTAIHGTHKIEVEVSYDQRGVQVDYRSSENLNYRVIDGIAYIHPKYNKWVTWLVQDIVAKATF